MKEYLSKKSVHFYLAAVAAVVALISAVLYIATDYGDRTFSFIPFALVIAGAVLFVVSEVLTEKFKNNKVMSVLSEFLPILPSICFSIATAFEIYLMLPTLSDIWNNVNFIGGNVAQSIAFSCLFFVSAVLSVISNFGVFERKTKA